ncbi:MAG: hypothetical protein LW832_09520 [Parachlamydia sp.]|jgi:hypothetical protein|nr:hypothetical protein [Parachlamydia sp.]
MIFKNLFFILIAILSTHLSAETNEKKQYEKEMKEFVNAFDEQMKKEYEIKMVIWGGNFRDYFKEELEFYAFRHATLDEARALILAVRDKLILAIQANPRISHYFEEGIFHETKGALTPDKIAIQIEFVRGSTDHRTFNDGSIDKAWIWLDHSSPRKMKLEYTRTDPFYEFNYSNNIITHFAEFLEEATELNALSPISNPAIHEFEEFENELDQTLFKFCEKMRIKHGLYFESIAWRDPWKKTSIVSEIRLKSTLYSSLSLKAARSLFLQITEELIHTINSNDKIKIHLAEYPFPPSRLKFSLLCRTRRFFTGDSPYYDGSVESISYDANNLTYFHYKRNPNPNSINFNPKELTIYLKETYQEAITASKENHYSIKERFLDSIKNSFYSITSFFETAIIYLIFHFSEILFFLLMLSIFIIAILYLIFW